MLQIICQRLTIITGLLFIYAPLTAGVPAALSSYAYKAPAPWLVDTSTKQVLKSKGVRQDIVWVRGCEYETKVQYNKAAGTLHCLGSPEQAQPYAYHSRTATTTRTDSVLIEAVEVKCDTGYMQLETSTDLRSYNFDMSCNIKDAPEESAAAKDGT